VSGAVTGRGLWYTESLRSTENTRPSAGETASVTYLEAQKEAQGKPAQNLVREGLVRTDGPSALEFKAAGTYRQRREVSYIKVADHRLTLLKRGIKPGGTLSD